MVTDDLEAAVKFAPMVVGQLQNEEVLEQVTMFLWDLLHLNHSFEI
jgi:hypothetical protein